MPGRGHGCRSVDDAGGSLHLIFYVMMVTMRTNEELKRRWVAKAQGLVTGHSISTGTGKAAELLLSTLMEDLCYLDDRDGDFRRITDELNERYGQAGINGLFKSVFDREQCQAEVAAVYAEAFCRLGYVQPVHMLSPGHWADLANSLPALFDEHDMRLSEAEAKLGRPSGVVDDRILCYASSNRDAGWIFVEGHDVITRSYDVSAGRNKTAFDPDPLVRSVRRSAADFEEGLVMTPYGKLLRWGEGWWIDHPSPDWPAETLAIAAQLRDTRESH